MFDSIMGFDLKVLSALFSSAMFIVGLLRLLNSMGTRIILTVGTRKFTGHVWTLYAEPVSFNEITVRIKNKGSVTAELDDIEVWAKKGKNRPAQLPLAFRSYKSKTVEIPVNGEWATSVRLDELLACMGAQGDGDVKEPMNLRIRFVVRDRDKHKHRSEWFTIPPDALPKDVTGVDESEL